jgi:hypothetical protein
MHGDTDNLKPEVESANTMPGRAQMVRDLIVFQCKLLADGFRDLLLVPLSLGAAIVALLRRGPTPGPEFYDVLRMGRSSEHWINLFGAVSQVHGPESGEDRHPGNDIDELVSRVESFVVDEYRSGAVTAQAKAKLDRALAAMRRRNKDKPQD